MFDIEIKIAGIILLAVVAFSCGYEKGLGDAMEDEIDFLERPMSKEQPSENGCDN